jgi:hypothetical protein
MLFCPGVRVCPNQFYIYNFLKRSAGLITDYLYLLKEEVYVCKSIEKKTQMEKYN